MTWLSRVIRAVLDRWKSRVQYGTVLLHPYQMVQTATISAVNTSRSRLTVKRLTGNVSVALVDNTTVSVRRLPDSDETTPIIVSYEIREFL